MQVFNRPGFVHQHTIGMDTAGREYFSFVVKGTFAFPERSGAVAELAPDQQPLVFADELTGEPGFSATRWETDFAFRKPKCDVVLQGAAYAPGGRKASRVQVGLRVGGWQKIFHVVGHREWRVVGPQVLATDPYPFARQPFGYDTAFGGIDRLNPDDPKPPAYLENPVGRGFASFRNQSKLSGQPLPNTEEVGVPIASPYEAYRPMGFGPIWRGRADRIRYGGTYDQHWEENVFPFLPADFDERYYQQVGADQQIDRPKRSQEVVILNLTPSGRETLRLPDPALPLTLFRGWECAFQGLVHPDTLLFDTEARRLSMVWRVQVPMRRMITEFTEAWIGRPRPGQIRAKAMGKPYRDLTRDGFRMPADHGELT
ncbi:DUF2169 domain-containing protein [Puniceibacterium sp. IMCC21224]|uniref:DUF2169 family type VI secretion system accessory protein n=1 Tax=Puniceibacterium sp. IMCC21224 TaxID=1618204 RepID=UPI00064DFC05|nr:DUF2169 domain-containing protein [Puniceibacterium sp. IMCC21224]KMK65249.1 hypothetical protein IMCC21224_1179 [Puniceibacterium sp. IMCC21224]